MLHGMAESKPKSPWSQGLQKKSTTRSSQRLEVCYTWQWRWLAAVTLSVDAPEPALSTRRVLGFLVAPDHHNRSTFIHGYDLFFFISSLRTLILSLNIKYAISSSAGKYSNHLTNLHGPDRHFSNRPLTQLKVSHTSRLFFKQDWAA